MTTETSIYEFAKCGASIDPEKVAIWFNDQKITFQDLFNRVDAVADHLHEMGVCDGTVVTIHISNCPEAIIAIYAVAKLGGICSMIHPLMPVESLFANLAFTESSFLITDCSYKGNANIITCEQIREMCYTVKSVPYGFPDSVKKADQCAVYMISGGTTGKPKVVKLSHESMNRYIKNLASYADYSLNNVVSLSVAPFFHIMGLLGDVHRSICTGATMVLLSRWDALSAVEYIKKYGINFLTGVPKMYEDLLGVPNFTGGAIESITHCYLGGDTVPVKLIDEIDERIGHRGTFSVYGMTELGGIVCTLTNEHYRRGASGYPIDNSFVKVMDSNGHISSSGEGELICFSESSMMGYLKDSLADDDVFIDEDGLRFVKTGDYGRVDDDGFVFFISRVKNIIIHNGYNIIPQEVEGAIAQALGVKEVYVFGSSYAGSTESVFAAVVPNEEMTDLSVLKQDIMNECESILPKYAHPEKIFFLHSLPRTAMNKVDKEALLSLIY